MASTIVRHVGVIRKGGIVGAVVPPCDRIGICGTFVGAYEVARHVFAI
jgi:hypothetical protein